MKSLKNKLITSILIGMIFFTYSCQSLTKLYTGIKDPEIYLSQKGRLEYYEPFFEDKDSLDVEIYSITNIENLQYAFNNFQNYPQVYLINKSENKIYGVNCYDDVSYSIEEIEEGKFENYINEEIINDNLKIAKEILSNKSQLVYEKQRKVTSSKIILDNSNWKALIVSGTFLGKKIRKKTLPILELEDLTKLKIIDLSINKEES